MNESRLIGVIFTSHVTLVPSVKVATLEYLLSGTDTNPNPNNRLLNIG